MDRSPVALKVIHLIPEDHDDEWHTTADCWCDPVRIDLKVGVLTGADRVVFHRERRTDKTENEETP